MWKKTAPLMILLSVALNIAFISIWAVHAARVHWPGDAARDNGLLYPLHRQLGVTKEQWQRIEPRIAEFHSQSEAIRTDMHRLRTQLVDLIAADDPDRDAIAAKQEEIRAGQQRMQELVVEHLLAEKQLLTAEQQKELFDLIRQRSACHGPARMMGLPGADSLPGSHRDHPQE